MKRILNKMPIPALLCSAVLAASPVFAQGVGAGGSVGAGTPASPLAGAPGIGIGASAGPSLGTTTTGTLNSNAANPALGAPSPSTSMGGNAGINPNASVSANPGGPAANGSINTPTPGSNGVNTSDQQTTASQMAQRAQANANAAQLSQFNQQGLTNGQPVATANGPAQ